MEPQASLLRLIGISKSYGSGDQAVRILNDVDFNLARAEFVAIKGPSGAGKSTLLHIAAGLDHPTEGTVVFDGSDLGMMSENDRTMFRRKHLGFVFQFFNLVPGIDVRDNVALPLLLDGMPRGEAAETAAEAIREVGLGHRMDHLAGELSGGEMQRTAVARAIAPKPALIVADEPTGNLDTQTGDAVLDLLAGLCAERATAILMVTHEDRAAARADRVVEVRDGRLTDHAVADTAIAERRLSG
ncbi:MAG: ABC transporter ATP-binding protein [Solirubrobacterales bacterium]|nr:ABC transporter ATP-binding protein [Solirubrobacterales bacterium]